MGAVYDDLKEREREQKRAAAQARNREAHMTRAEAQAAVAAIAASPERLSGFFVRIGYLGKNGKVTKPFR